MSVLYHCQLPRLSAFYLLAPLIAFRFHCLLHV